MSGNGGQRRAVLAEQQEAIRDYLDALLQEIPDGDGDATEAAAPRTASPAAPAEPQSAVEQAPAPARPAAQPAADPEPAPAADPEPEADPGPEPEVAADATTVPESEPAAEDTVPDGGSGAVQALFFHVGGLQLAVRLTDLHSVVPWHEVTVTPMPGQPHWHRGIMRHRGRNVHVIDTAAMVLPPGSQDSEEARRPPDHVLIVGDGDWGLACHDIGDVVRLGPEDVKWRRAGGRRPWLAGTAINHLCAILDPGAFTGMLERERARR